MKSLKGLFGLISVIAAMAAVADLIPAGTDEEVRERLAPFGSLCRAGEECAAAQPAAAAGAALSGVQVYDQFCATCHAAGVAGAPVFASQEVWDPRLAQGMDTLWDHTLNGINAMPAKGTCMNCSDEELRAALDYMLEPVQ